MFAGAPVLLGSVWDIGAVPSLSALLKAGITGEETVPAREPDGYQDFVRPGRCWCFPFLWQEPRGQTRTIDGNPDVGTKKR